MNGSSATRQCPIDGYVPTYMEAGAHLSRNFLSPILLFDFRQFDLILILGFGLGQVPLMVLINH